MKWICPYLKTISQVLNPLLGCWMQISGSDTDKIELAGPLLNLLILLLLVELVGFEPTANRANRFALPTELKLRALNLLLLFGVADSICDDYEGALLRWQLPPQHLLISMLMAPEPEVSPPLHRPNL
jgi:hypothetical protein